MIVVVPTMLSLQIPDSRFWLLLLASNTELPTQIFPMSGVPPEECGGVALVGDIMLLIMWWE